MRPPIGLGDRDPLDLAPLEGDHLAPGAVEGGLDGGDAEAGAQDAVEGDRAAAALDVAQRGGAALDAGAAVDLAGQDLADPAEDLVAVDVDLGRRDREGAGLGQGALGDDDDGGVAALLVAPDDALAHLVDVEGLLGGQRDRGAAGEARPDRDVADVAAHHLDDEHAVVALRRRVQAVDGVGADLDRGLEAERHLGEADVVVDRLGDADDGEAVLVEAVDHAHRALTADPDDGVETVAVVGLADPAQTVLAGEGLVAGGPEDRAALGQDATADLDVEGLVVVVDDASPRVAEADDGAVVGDFGGTDGAPDDGVEAGAVPASCQDAEAHVEASFRWGDI